MSSSYKYELGVIVDTEGLLFFKNGILLTPGVDYIIGSPRSISEGSFAVFKNELQDGDNYCLCSGGEVFWYKAVGKDGVVSLVDQSTDQPGFVSRFTEWLPEGD
jgi:hypothetical protein